MTGLWNTSPVVVLGLGGIRLYSQVGPFDVIFAMGSVKESLGFVADW